MFGQLDDPRIERNKLHPMPEYYCYFIALKGNQESLHDDVKLHFEHPTREAKTTLLFAETVDKGHGRIEVRRCQISNDIDWLKQRHPAWEKLNWIVAIESERHIGQSVSKETRYFIGSKTVTTEEALAAVRLH